MTETKAKYTPGPWNNSGRWADDIRDNSGRIIAQTTQLSNDYDPSNLAPEELGNARLIAAAPELLETLEHAHIHFLQSNSLTVDDREILDEMWAAIRRAKGEL